MCIGKHREYMVWSTGSITSEQYNNSRTEKNQKHEALKTEYLEKVRYDWQLLHQKGTMNELPVT